MQTGQLKRNASQIYLTLVPFLAAVFGLGVGYISYKIYLPIWIINVCLMVTATWILGAHVIKAHDVEKNHLVVCALFLIIPWMLISMFFGLGAPPFGKPAEWVASATEQDVRYFFLIVAGVFYAFGFAVLREKLKNTRGNLYSLLGFIAIQIAIPLFLMDMTFLGFYVDKLYSIMAASGLEKTPEWGLPIANQFRFIPIIVVSLTYMATAAFAASLKAAGWFRPTACNIYIVISLLGFLLNVLPPSVPEPLATVSFIATIPAIPFLMPYLIGINLLKRAGN
jgi:hypothetical protein